MTDGLKQSTSDESVCCLCGEVLDDPTEFVFNGEPYCESCFHETVTDCSHCGEKLLRTDAKLFEGGPYCPQCYEDLFIQCECCNALIRIARVRETASGEQVCWHCFDEYYFVCDSCGDATHSDFSFGTASGDTICEHCYENEYFTCQSCEEIHHTDSYGSDGCCVDCSREQSSDPECADDEDRPANTVESIRTSGLKSTRTVGVEIECYPSRDDEVRFSNFNRPSLRIGRWRDTEDGSLGRGGAEFVSPILPQSQYRDLIFRFCNEVIPGATVDKRCGTHIHLDSSDLSWWNLANLHAYCYKYEEDFFSLVSPSRSDNQYCCELPKAPDASSKKDVTKAYYGREKMELQKGSKYPRHSFGVINRYWWLNIHAHFYQRTIEVRLHHGTTNPEKISNWIALWLEVLPVACGNPKSWKPPLELLSTELRAYWSERKAKFNQRRAA